ncbi:hypothetical protein [Aeromicrobium sp. Root472D3]|uniref:rolling circle replication-associated protein n=1 Tax=Aeromicrobium sp. Root472D3 TaxID=1736540 RepID=UPI0009EC4376|nr:hypothetical protein [Aeromicrobium sp. Root472D3]
MSSSILLSPDAGWRLSLYPTAGEAGCSFQSSIRAERRYVAPGAAADPARSRAEAARRARSKVRRYAASNLLDRFGTLTYGPPFCLDPAQARRDVAVFVRDLRTELGGSPFPYIWVPEWHKDGKKLHLHFALGNYVRQSVLSDVWGRGWVCIKRISGQRHNAPRVEGARIAARYLSKYVAKTFESESLGGRHRYEVGQGFQPQAVRFSGTSDAQVLSEAVDVMGGKPPSRSWASSENENWQGPPARWFQWD